MKNSVIINKFVPLSLLSFPFLLMNSVTCFDRHPGYTGLTGDCQYSHVATAHAASIWSLYIPGRYSCSPIGNNNNKVRFPTLYLGGGAFSETCSLFIEQNIIMLPLVHSSTWLKGVHVCVFVAPCTYR